MPPTSDAPRLDYLDAVRAFALLLGVVFHASLSFMPVAVGWAVMDLSTSPVISAFVVASHSFRMEVFFLIAGFFSHLSFHRKGAAAFLASRFTRIVLPFVIGWFVLRPLIVSGWIMGAASMRGDVDIAGGLLGGFQSLKTLPAGIFTGSHLWFLYYLALVTVAALALRALIKASGSWYEPLVRRADAALAWLAASRLALPVLIVPTAGVLWSMRGWGMDTPDQSLRPHIPVLLVYGGCFVLGWMLHRTPALIKRLTRLSVSRWALAGLACAATVMLSVIQGDPGHPYFMAARAAYVVSYASMMWSLVLLTVGVFRKIFRRQNRAVRFVADSSYWMYLIHLPLVVWLQVAVAELPLHWSIKLIAVATLVIAISLITYDLFVRSTIIGRTLNGRRHERDIFRAMRRPRLEGVSAA